MRKLVAALACRNNGSRLFGKPLQNLDIENRVTVLDNIVDCLRQVLIIDEIVLGISYGVENDIFVEYANSKNISHIRGSEEDVLNRLIQCGDFVSATDVFRITSESPFPYFDFIDQLWMQHINDDNDATFLDEIIDGCGLQIVSMEALKRSHIEGEDKHRSELCTLYIRENKEKFNIGYIDPPQKLIRRDIRLTVDYPEDLVVCRAVYENFKAFAPNIPLLAVVDYLDDNIQLLKLTSPFCEEGYKNMYL